MTCIIGLIEDGVAYMGGDSAVSFGWTRDTLSTRKVFTVGEFLIGFSGEVRMANILKYHLNVAPQSEGDTDEKYIVVQLVDAIRKAAKELGHVEIDKSKEHIGGAFLVAYKQRLYFISSDLSVVTVTGDLYACGSGYEVALGAMTALPTMKPKKRIQRALEISAQYVPSVAAPFYVEMQSR